MSDDGMAALLAAAAEVEAKIATCHERRACPTCRAPIGERCCRMPAGYSLPHIRKLTKHPHKERWGVPAR